MAIIHEIKFNNLNAICLYTSNALPRKNNVRIHYHSLIEISLILKGRGKYKANNTVYDISEGDIFFFRPNEAHCITDVDDDGMEILNLHVAPYYLYTNLQNALNANFIKILTLSFKLKSNKINDTLSPSKIEVVKALMESIKQEFIEKKSDYITLVNNYISALLITFSRVYNEQGFSKKELQNYQKLLVAVEYIDNHYKENISLEELSLNVNYSRCYFSTIFKKCMGMAVWDYISIKRIERALSLIKTTDKNILDIALDCGFNNTVNFNKIFKKYTNLLPSAFRK